MSEQAPSSRPEVDTAERLPTRDEFITAFAEKRLQLVASLKEVQDRPGFKLDAIEMMNKRREEREAQRALGGLDDEWNNLGGAELAEAQAAVDALNFKSDATERIKAMKHLTAAKDVVYENFLATSNPEMEATEEEDRQAAASTADTEDTPEPIEEKEGVLEQQPGVVLSPKRIAAKRAEMVQSGLGALDVGNMSDDEIAAYMFALEAPKARAKKAKKSKKVARRLPGSETDATIMVEQASEGLDTEVFGTTAEGAQLNSYRSQGERTQGLGRDIREFGLFAALGGRLSRWQQERRERDSALTAEERERRNNRRVVYGALGAVGVVATGLALAYAVSRGHDVTAAMPRGMGQIDPTQHADTISQAHPQEVASHDSTGAHTELLQSGAWDIPSGSGGEALMNRLGVDADTWYANQDEFLRQFPGEAYRMDDGNVGLNYAGRLSDKAINFWTNKL